MTNTPRDLVRRLPTAWLAAFICVPLLAAPVTQPLYMPRAVKQAFAKHTRSLDGKPGANYWQNRARYAITVTTAPPNRNVSGTEQITYANNSPDTLHSVMIKLFVNIHKP